MNNPLCIITGASGDIGSELSLELGKEYRLALIARNEIKLYNVLDKLQNKDHKAYVGDINNDQKREEIIQQIIVEQGNPSVIIHGAAAFGDPKKLHNYTDAEIEEIIDTNFTTIAKLTKDLVPYMNGGSIITIGSTSYKTPYPKRLLYAATKRALQSYTETNAIDYQGQNIGFYYIVPGPTEGERVKSVIQERVKTSRKNIEDMEYEYKKINGGEFLKVRNITDTVQALLYNSLNVPSGATLGIDNFGIFEDSYPDFSTNNGKKHEFLQGKSRKYIFLWNDTSSIISNKKNKTYNKELIHTAKNTLVRYGIVGLILLSLIQTTDMRGQVQKIVSHLQGKINNTKIYEYEMNRIAKEQYGINNINNLIEKGNKTHQNEPIDLYVKIGFQARENMKQYEQEGYKIQGGSRGESIDI